MKEELEKVKNEWIEEVKKINTINNSFPNNQGNKTYHDLERKYKNKIKKIKEKYNTQK